ncbi:MAG TPA: AraC family transcriptional regulator ligand-binding domain-containing protein [Verrucomicrobiae bacterium]|nr:AraC family transcriptional regulator ligand-binding domain-containing protein [Verrucomicrobiae bacterium]
MPSRELPIPFITLPNWVKAAGECGFNIEPVFRELGIQTDLVHLESATITVPVLEQVMTACVARTRRPRHFPFVLGETFAFEYLPDLETFLSTSPTLREAVRVLEWVRELINPMIQVRLEERGEFAALVLDMGEGRGPTVAYFTESLVASLVKFGRRLLQGRGDYERLTLRYRAPKYAKEYQRYLKMATVFGQPRTALEFPRALLDRPLEGAYPALHQQAEYRVEQRLSKLTRTDGLVAAIEAACLREPRLLGLGIERVADKLGLGARTLQRRLQDEGQRFADVLARMRYRLAIRHLEQPGADVESVSEKLGFSDRRSFTRAFTRWSGVTPSAFLRRVSPEKTIVRP